METTWILVADSGRARILSQIDGTDELSLVEYRDNPAGRAHVSDIVADHPGRFEKHGGDARSTMDPPTDPHEQKAREFAHELNQRLSDAEYSGAFHRLIVVAPGHFLGLLKSAMKSGPKRRLVQCASHDLTRLSLSEMQSHLKALLRSPAALATPPS